MPAVAEAKQTRSALPSAPSERLISAKPKKSGAFLRTRPLPTCKCPHKISMTNGAKRAGQLLARTPLGALAREGVPEQDQESLDQEATDAIRCSATSRTSFAMTQEPTNSPFSGIGLSSYWRITVRTCPRCVVNASEARRFSRKGVCDLQERLRHSEARVCL